MASFLFEVAPLLAEIASIYGIMASYQLLPQRKEVVPNAVYEGRQLYLRLAEFLNLPYDDHYRAQSAVGEGLALTIQSSDTVAAVL